MPSINIYQVFLIIVAVLSAVAGSTAQLNDLFGATTAHTIVSVATFSTAIITAALTPLFGNAGMVKTVAAMPGVTKVTINPQAPQAIAAAAVDTKQPKVGAANSVDQMQLETIARG